MPESAPSDSIRPIWLRALRRDALVPWGIGILSLTLATVKACTAGIVNDEAIVARIYVGHLAQVFGEYWSTNHILQTFFMWLSTSVGGVTPFTMRLPSLISWGCLVIGLYQILRDVIPGKKSRWLFFACIALHPYLLDYAALARGYILMLAFTTWAVWCLGRALNGRQGSPPRLLLLLSGSFLGLAMITLPIALREAVCLSAIAAVYLLRREGAKGLLSLVYLGLPQAVIAGSVYLPLMPIGRGGFFLGAQNLATAFKTVQGMLYYVDQGLVTADGYPALWAPLQPISGPRLAWLSEWQMGWPGWLILVLAICGLLAAPWLAWRRGARLMPVLCLPGLLGVHAAVEHLAFDLPLPFLRLAIQFLYWGMVAAAVGVGLLTAHRGRPSWVYQYGELLCLILVALLLVNNLARFSLRHYFEAPDNGLVPEILARIDSSREGRPVSIGHPWYLGECFRYYRDFGGMEWIVLADPAAAELPGSTYMVLNLSNMDGRRYIAYDEVAHYPGLNVYLLRREEAGLGLSLPRSGNGP